MNTRERLELIENALRKQVPLKILCEVFECSQQDLREMVRLSRPNLLSAFDMAARSSEKEPPPAPSHMEIRERQRALRRHLRWGNAVARGKGAASAVRRESALSSEEQEFAEVLRGTRRFVGRNRPLYRLAEDDQERVMKEAALFIDWREQH